MLRTLGSGGGLDLIGVILNRRWNVGVGRFSFTYNAVMFLAAVATMSLDLIIVSFLQVFIASGTLEYVLRWGNGRKMVYVVCERGEEICEAIIAEGYGGATILKGKGAYSGDNREIILTVTNNILCEGWKTSFLIWTRARFSSWKTRSMFPVPAIRASR